MKRILFTAIAAFMMLTSASAQRLTNIAAEAQFITDKMMVELGLSSSQRNSILQINVNYLDGISSYRDIGAKGWKHRNKRLKALLSEKQWKMYKKADYFYRPIGWRDNAYVHNIYARYPKQGPVRRFGKMQPPKRKIGEFDKHHPKDARRFEKGEREFRNNSPEAIQMRRDMRKGMPEAR